MGIDGFNKVIKEQYFKSFSNFWYQYYDYVYIDINMDISYIFCQQMYTQQVESL